MRLHNCVDEVAIKRPGHQPHKSTIEARLNARAHSNPRDAELNRVLWRMRRGR